MHILTRRAREAIQIGEAVTVTVIRVGNDTVKLGIEAPPDVPVRRGELDRPAKKEGGIA